MPTLPHITLAVAAVTAVLAGCSKPDTPAAAADSTAAAVRAPAVGTPSAGASGATAPGDTIVRGTLVRVSDTALVIGAAAGGEVRVALTPPVQVYAREPADLSKVSAHTFVGVTSVAQPDGSQRATEIHIFPEELRGLGEGSRPMGQSTGGAGPSTMTNGAVRSTMTNGTVAPNAPPDTSPRAESRMTNGAVRASAGAARVGSALTVEYQGGSQTITVPAGVTVTAIAPTTTKLTAGANVIVLAMQRPDGTLESSRVMLAPPPRARP